MITDEMVNAVTDELLAHGEFSSTCNNRPNAKIAAEAVIDIIRSALSTSQPNRMGTTPEMQKMYDRFGGETLETLIREYARDLRRNSSGGDDYPFEIMTGVADYLEVLIGRASPPEQPAADPAIALLREGERTMGNEERVQWKKRVGTYLSALSPAAPNKETQA